MISKKVKQLKTLFLDFAAYQNHKKFIPSKNENVVLVDFKNPQLYHRFFYLLLKFYQLAGYTVYYPMNFSLYRNFRNKDQYMALLLMEKGLLTITKKNLPEKHTIINDEMLSADYFKSYFENQNIAENDFHVPMSFHPLMYHHQLWNIPVEFPNTRYNAIFCYGNFDRNAYLDIKKTYFKVISRTEIYNSLKDRNDFVAISSSKDLENKGNLLDKKLVFALRENYQVQMKDIRPHLSLFNFYFCCPGVVMPLCHNVAEAMSVGTIPIIEKEYAEVMYPNLEHQKNALIFDDFNDLEKLFNEIFTLPQKQIDLIRENVLSYYKEFLSPEGMIKNLNHSIAKGEKIYLQAEHRSVKFKSKT